MTIGDRIRATRRPGKEHPAEYSTPGRPQHTPATPENPTPPGADQRPQTRQPLTARMRRSGGPLRSPLPAV